MSTTMSGLDWKRSISSAGTGAPPMIWMSPGLQRCRQRLGLGDRLDDHALELGPRGIVVVLERLEHDRLAQAVLDDPERAGADRRQAVLRLAELIERAAVDDGERTAAGALGGLDQERGLRPGELEAHGQRVDRLGAQTTLTSTWLWNDCAGSLERL